MRRQPIRIVRKDDRCFAVLEGGRSVKPEKNGASEVNKERKERKKHQERAMIFLLPPLLLLLMGVQVAHLLHWSLNPVNSLTP